jgi:hypothetical protein
MDVKGSTDVAHPLPAGGTPKLAVAGQPKAGRLPVRRSGKRFPPSTYCVIGVDG